MTSCVFASDFAVVTLLLQILFHGIKASKGRSANLASAFASCFTDFMRVLKSFEAQIVFAYAIRYNNLY
jgi:hypothetical protein